MNSDERNWLDVLSDGRLVRDWLSLNTHIVFASAIWGLLILLFSLGLGLALILIGLPILLLTFASVRTLAALDHQMTAGLLNRPAADLHDDVDPRGANFGERFGLYLGSGVTWRSLIYLALKIPLGTFTITAAWMLLPFIALEVLIMGPLGIDLHMITPRLTQWLALIAHELPSAVLAKVPQPRPAARSEKSKNDLRISRLETIEDEDDVLPRYVLTDDGEIVRRR
ncbi:MAG: sensor domain-containing protein [Chloroflexota bacterium]|nr:sensor domain-containing protein [Chloroflexota bacterium]